MAYSKRSSRAAPRRSSSRRRAAPARRNAAKRGSQVLRIVIEQPGAGPVRPTPAQLGFAAPRRAKY